MKNSSKPDPLFLSIFFPCWSTDLYQRKMHAYLKPGQAILLSQENSKQSIVARCCRRAASEGIVPGTPLALAEALLDKKPLCSVYNAEQDFRLLYKTALKLLRFSPLVAVESDLMHAYHEGHLNSLGAEYWGLQINLSGTKKLYGNYKSLVQKLHNSFRASGINARFGIAPTPGAAWAFARYSEKLCILLDKNLLKAKLLELPIQALRLGSTKSQESELALFELGLFTIADILSLPRKKLPERFGALLLERIDQLFGYSKEELCYVQDIECFEISREFEHPLNQHAAIHKSLLTLLTRVSQHLQERGKKAGSFLLSLSGTDSAGQSFQIKKEIALNNSSQSPAHISSVIQPIISSLRPSGAVNQVQVRAHGLEKVFATQKDLSWHAHLESEQVQSDELDEFINSIVLRLGNKKVCCLELHETYIPEKAFSFTPLKNKHRIRKRHAFSSARFFYPSHIFQEPEAVAAIALLPDRPPSQIIWNGVRLDIRRSFGPERISAEWWHTALHSQQNCIEREYFNVQDNSGRWLWLYRERNSCNWFIHGIWT